MARLTFDTVTRPECIRLLRTITAIGLTKCNLESMDGRLGYLGARDSGKLRNLTTIESEQNKSLRFQITVRTILSRGVPSR